MPFSKVLKEKNIIHKVTNNKLIDRGDMFSKKPCSFKWWYGILFHIIDFLNVFRMKPQSFNHIVWTRLQSIHIPPIAVPVITLNLDGPVQIPVTQRSDHDWERPPDGVQVILDHLCLVAYRETVMSQKIWDLWWFKKKSECPFLNTEYKRKKTHLESW